MTQRTASLELVSENTRAAVERMAADFGKASPYGQYGVDAEVIQTTVDSFLKDRHSRTCIVLMVGGEPHGVLAALCSQNIFNKHRICVELIWWIDPEYRTFGHSKLMLDSYEYWAKEVKGAQLIQMVSLDDQLTALYTRRGYIRAENSFIKEVV